MFRPPDDSVDVKAAPQIRTLSRAPVAAALPDETPRPIHRANAKWRQARNREYRMPDLDASARGVESRSKSTTIHRASIWIGAHITTRWNSDAG